MTPTGEPIHPRWPQLGAVSGRGPREMEEEVVSAMVVPVEEAAMVVPVVSAMVVPVEAVAGLCRLAVVLWVRRAPSGSAICDNLQQTISGGRVWQNRRPPPVGGNFLSEFSVGG